MGVYSNNRTQLGMYSSDEVVANENYTHQTGLLEMIIDNAKNEQAMFEAVISTDFREAAGLVTESTEVLNEGVSDIIDKLKKFVMDCWERVKGVFKSFLVKFNNLIMRDSKEFVKKYQKEVVGKDYSKMKYKYRVYHANARTAANAVADISIDAGKTLSNFKNFSTNIEDKLEEIENGKLIDRLLSTAVKSTSKDDFYKDYEKAVFDDQEEYTGLDNGLLRSIIAELTSHKESVSALEKLQSETDKLFKTVLSEIDKYKKVQVDKATGSDNRAAANGTNMAKRANAARRYVEVQQTAVNMLIKADMDMVKKLVAQCRRVYGQCVSFNPKLAKENALFVEAFGEAVEYDFISDYEDYSL